MSPEQIRGTQAVDARTDIWGLGASLYELLSGRVAFQSSSITAVCAMVLETQPPPLLEVSHVGRGGLARVVFRCLEKDPARRYPNLGELANALARYAPPSAVAHAEHVKRILRLQPASSPIASAQPPSPPAPATAPATTPAVALTVNPAFADPDPDDDGASMLPPGFK
jgi:serine/threonine protein kinase